MKGADTEFKIVNCICGVMTQMYTACLGLFEWFGLGKHGKVMTS